METQHESRVLLVASYIENKCKLHTEKLISHRVFRPKQKVLKALETFAAIAENTESYHLGIEDIFHTKFFTSNILFCFYILREAVKKLLSDRQRRMTYSKLAYQKYIRQWLL